MKTWVKIDAYDLEDDDMICGFKLKDLIICLTMKSSFLKLLKKK